VAVGREHYVVDFRDAGFDQAEDRGVLLRGGVADRVGDVDGGGPGLDGDGDHLEEELRVGAGAVLGGELDVVGEGAGEADRLGGLVESLVAGEAELVLEMEVGGGEDDVDAVGWGGLDVFAFGAGERGDAGAADLAGDGSDGGEVALGGNGESGLEDVYAEGRDLVAKRSFSSWCMVQPGDCSPSRRVVSKKTIWFGLGIGFGSSIWALS
jgi:hypothetical protein